MKIQAVFFDIGGVILQIDIHRTLQALGVQDLSARKRIVQQVVHWDLHHQYERGEISTSEFYQGWQALLGHAVATDVLESAWNDLIIGPLPGIEDVLAEFRSRGATFYTLSNTNIVHHSHAVRKFSVFSLFDQLLASHELGARKPEPECFERALERAGLPASSCLFIDDTVANVQAAQHLGLHAATSVNSSATTRAILAQFLGS